MSTSASPTPDKPSAENEFSDYRQSSDIVITVDTGNSVCSTILVEGCSDDLDLSLNDDAVSFEKSSEAGEEQNDVPTPRVTRSKTIKAPARVTKRASPVKKARKGRKTRSRAQDQSSASRKRLSTYLRSAVLSRDEINREVLHYSKADVPKPREASLFTTKLMMRLASRLPPSRVRPTCEELKEMMNANRDGEMDHQNFRSIGQGTPLRVKAEMPSFCETINHVMQPSSFDNSSHFNQDLFFEITCSNVHCREEREHKIAMLQQQSVQEEAETKLPFSDDATIESLQIAMRNSNCPNRKEIEKQIALQQLESLRGKRGRPSK